MVGGKIETYWSVYFDVNVFSLSSVLYVWYLLVSHHVFLNRSVDLAVRNFMRRYHPGVRRVCLGHQRVGGG